MKRIILRLLGLLALVGISFGLARLLVMAWLPGEAARLLLGIPLLAVVFLLIYWALFHHYRYTKDIPHFLLRPDFLLPLSAYITMLLLFAAIAPRLAIWWWGAGGTGTVQALAVEERFDPDYGVTRHFRVDYLFATESSDASSHISYISEELFDTLQIESGIAVHYVPWWPGLITAGDLALFSWQAAVVTWTMLIVMLWLIGTAATSRYRYAPPMPPPYPAPQTAVELLNRYDLDRWLTDVDDVELWSAVISEHFPMPEDETMHAAGLRFGLAELSPEARLKMQPVDAACFTRRDQHHLRRTSCVADEKTDADFDTALTPSVPMLMLYLNKSGREKWPLFSILVPRPSIHEQRLPVYTAVCQGNGNASGETAYWERLSDGRWQHSGEKINWWMDGA